MSKVGRGRAGPAKSSVAAVSLSGVPGPSGPGAGHSGRVPPWARPSAANLGPFKASWNPSPKLFAGLSSRPQRDQRLGGCWDGVQTSSHPRQARASSRPGSEARRQEAPGQEAESVDPEEVGGAET